MASSARTAWTRTHQTPNRQNSLGTHKNSKGKNDRLVSAFQKYMKISRPSNQCGGHLKLNIPLDQPWNCSYANEGEVQRPVDESNERTTRWWFLMKIGVSALDELQAMKYLITFAGEGYF